MKCKICTTELIEKRWKLEFMIGEKFISVINYPILVCPTCGNCLMKKKVTKKVIEKLNERENFYLNATAINFEEVS